jgi:hypothetical protein
MSTMPHSLNAPFPVSAPPYEAESGEGRAAPHAAPERNSNDSNDTPAVRMRDPYFCFELI